MELCCKCLAREHLRCKRAADPAAVGLQLLRVFGPRRSRAGSAGPDTETCSTRDGDLSTSPVGSEQELKLCSLAVSSWPMRRHDSDDWSSQAAWSQKHREYPWTLQQPPNWICQRALISLLHTFNSLSGVKLRRPELISAADRVR